MTICTHLLRTLAVAALTATIPPAAQAAAPQVRTQAPGFYRMMLGDFEITALSDGTVTLPVDKLMTNTRPGQVEKLLAAGYVDQPVETSINAFLINTGSRLVMVDTGAGPLFGPAVGNQLLANLRTAGYQPEQVDDG